MKELIGKKITGLRINEDQSVLAFEEQTQVVHERGVLLGEGRVGLVSGERRSRTQQECGEN